MKWADALAFQSKEEIHENNSDPWWNMRVFGA
jgi:hypothetical protein